MKALKYTQYGFSGKKGTSCITKATTTDGRLGFFHQRFDGKLEGRGIDGKYSTPIYIDGELTKEEIQTVKQTFYSQIA